MAAISKISKKKCPCKCGKSIKRVWHFMLYCSRDVSRHFSWYTYTHTLKHKFIYTLAYIHDWEHFGIGVEKKNQRPTWSLIYTVDRDKCTTSVALKTPMWSHNDTNVGCNTIRISHERCISNRQRNLNQTCAGIYLLHMYEISFIFMNLFL